MNFKKNYYLIAVVVIGLTACKKNQSIEEPNPKNKNTANSYADFLKKSTTSGYYGAVSYVAKRHTSGVTAPVTYDGSGAFYTQTGFNYNYKKSAGTLKIGAISLNPDASNGYNFGASEWYSTLNPPQFGANVTFSISGNPADGFAADSVTFYVPEEVKLSGPFISGLGVPTHSKSSDITVSWNPDANNDSVAVILVYNGPVSHRYDSTLPINPLSAVNFTSDDGSYTINASDFSHFPVGGVITLYVGRAGSGILKSNGREISVLGYTYGSQIFDLVL